MSALPERGPSFEGSSGRGMATRKDRRSTRVFHEGRNESATGWEMKAETFLAKWLDTDLGNGFGNCTLGSFVLLS